MTRFTQLILSTVAVGVLAWSELTTAADVSTSAALGSSGPLLAIMGLTGLGWLSNRLGQAHEAAPASSSRGFAAIAASLLLWIAPSQAGASSMILSEIFTSPAGPDDGLEWIELYNSGSTSIDLSSYSLGWGGADYTWGTLQLSGSVDAGDTFVVGGPISNALNFDPVFDQVANFDGDLQGGVWWVADGVALFDVPEVSITSSTLPIDAVVYGWPGATNSNGLIDASGALSAVDVVSYANNISFERGSSGWVVQPTPTPGFVSTPEPGSASTLLCGLALLATWRRSRLR